MKVFGNPIRDFDYVAEDENLPARGGREIVGLGKISLLFRFCEQNCFCLLSPFSGLLGSVFL